MRFIFSRTVRAVPFMVLAAPTLGAQSDTTATAASGGKQGLTRIEVTGRADDWRRAASTASEGRARTSDLKLRPLTREAALLEAIPGLIVTQHSGEGKANQYFVRGFNLDHGTDFQTRLDGMPLYMPSHAHGQGYTDLNFIIPELVKSIEYKLGVYHAEIGDFGSAGGAELRLRRELARPFISVGAGQHGLARMATGSSSRLGAGTLLLGGELKSYDGPWVSAERIRKLSTVGRYTWARGASQYSIMGMAYRNAWNATDQIPLRAVRGGRVPRFGAIDATDGGQTQRYSLSGVWRHLTSRGLLDANFFAIYSDLNLFSNFTYVLENPEHGDQFNQRERRVALGGSATHAEEASAFGVSHTLTLGAETRTDLISPIGLHRTHARARLGSVREDRVTQSSMGVFAQATSQWLPWLHTTLGGRGDVYAFSVASSLAANSGSRGAGIVSPKASLSVVPMDRLQLYVSTGFGFHSNDARGTTTTVDPANGVAVSAVDPLVRSKGSEVGLRFDPHRHWQSTVALWRLDLDSELLFVGDGGSTEASHGSRRQGMTITNVYEPIPQLTFDADFSLARARFTGTPTDQDRIPGALEKVIAAGLTWSAPTRGWSAALRARHFGSHALTEDNSVRGTASTLLNGSVGFPISGVRVQLSLLNMLNTSANDIQYYYKSRLPGEGDGVEDVHFHPVEPRQLRIALGWGLP